MKPTRGKGKLGKKQRAPRRERSTPTKRISSLARRGKTLDAFKLARGFPLNEDVAARIVREWNALRYWREHPELRRAGDIGEWHYNETLKRVERETARGLCDALLAGDPDLFKSIAKELRKPEPPEERDRLRAELLLHRLRKQNPGTTAV